MAKKPAAKPIELRQRVKEMRHVRAGDLESHPQNFRQHAEPQQQAVGQLLSTVGIADALLAFPADGKGPDGDFSRLMTFDGHLRKDRDPNQEWPVLVTDLTRAEADTMLAMLDHTAGLATIDPELARQLAASAKPAGLLPDAAWDAWATATKVSSDPASAAFAPNLTPTAGTNEVTAADISRTDGELSEQFSQQTGPRIVEITCPHCGQVFGVDARV